MSDWRKIIATDSESKMPETEKSKRISYNSNNRFHVKPFLGLNPRLFFAFAGIIFIVVLFFIIRLMVISSTVHKYEGIYPGVSVFGMDLSGMSLEQAREEIKGYGNNYYENKELKVVSGDKCIFIDVKSAMKSIDYGYVAGEAYNFGRNLPLRKQYRLIKKPETHELNISLGFTVNQDYVKNKVEELAALIETDFQNYRVTNTGNSFEITRGRDGISINRSETVMMITQALNNADFSPITVTSTVMKAEKPDVDYLRNTIYVEPQNAYLKKISSKNYEIVEGVIGVDIDVDQIKSDFQKEDWDYREYPFIYTEPVSSGQLKSLLFNDVLATYSTDLSSSSSDRTTNVSLAAKSVNGTLLMPKSQNNPADVFSFNNSVGERTEQAGYKNAKVFAEGEVVDGLGGGICQVSSTLYVAALLADLNITERHSHMFSVGYVPLGQDATVQWGYLDFKFENSSEYPIRIMAEVSGSTLTVSILGTITDPYKKVTLDTVVTGTKEYDTKYIHNPQLTYGKYVRIQHGQMGYTCEVYKNIYRDGELSERVLVNNTQYSAADQIIEINPLPSNS